MTKDNLRLFAFALLVAVSFVASLWVITGYPRAAELTEAYDGLRQNIQAAVGLN